MWTCNVNVAPVINSSLTVWWQIRQKQVAAANHNKCPSSRNGEKNTHFSNLMVFPGLPDPASPFFRREKSIVEIRRAQQSDLFSLRFNNKLVSHQRSPLAENPPLAPPFRASLEGFNPSVATLFCPCSSIQFFWFPFWRLNPTETPCRRWPFNPLRVFPY